MAAAILAWCKATRRLNMTDITNFLILQAPLLIPVIWVEIMRFHSIEHPDVAFRNFLVFEIFPILAALMVARKAARRGDQLRVVWERCRSIRSFVETKFWLVRYSGAVCT